MATEEYELTMTAFKSEEEYKQYQDTSKALDAFCNSVNFLDTVVTNKAFDYVVDFCSETGDIQNSVKIFSPVLEDGQSDREIFIEIGGKVVETITQSAFEAGGAKAGQIIGTAVFATGSIATSGLASAPAFVMGTVTGGAFYLGGKYIGIPIGEAVGEYSKEFWGKAYDNYLGQNKKVSIQDFETIDTETNKKTVFETNSETNQLEPVAQIDLTNNSVIPLKSGQTISHIAANTKYTSIELLEYNNLTLEEAKSLPVGFKVKIPADKPEILASENGNIKLYKNPDGTTSAILQGDNNTTYKVDNVIVSEDRKNLSYKKDGIEYEIEKDSNTGLMYTKEINSEDYNISFKMEDGKKVLEDIEIKNDDVSIKDFAKYVDYTEEEIKEFNHIQTDTVSTNDNIQLPVDKKMIEGGYGKITQYETQDGNYVFIVPNKDETTTTYATFTDGFNEKGSYEISPSGSITVSFEDRMVIANSDGYYFDSYGLEDKVDIQYTRLANGDLEVENLIAKEDINLDTLFKDTTFNKSDILFVNSIGEENQILAGQTIVLPKGESQYIDSAYGKVRMVELPDGNYVIEAPNEDGNYSKYYTTENATVEYNETTKETKVTLDEEDGSRQIDYSQIGNTAINQIGSLIIANNENFSNIEKIAVGTTVATIADFATYQGNNEFDTTQEGLDNLKGALLSFAVSSYFAKNDNISDILGMDGTFLGDFSDMAVSYALTDVISHAAFDTSSAFFNKAGDFEFNLTSLGNVVGGFIGNYLGNKVAESWIDTKEEAIGGSIGSAIGGISGASMAMTGGALATQFATFGTAAGPVGALIGAFIGVIAGSVLGGLFGGGTPPPPEAEALLEFDEENLTYSLISSDSDNGGNEEAMINIGNSFAKQLVNMFTIPGGQLVDASLMPQILVSQYKDDVDINGHKGTFDNINQIIADALSVEIPMINVENGDPYILRALNRTNETFLEGDPDSEGRADLEELYDSISIARDYSKYMNETLVILDSNGNLILDSETLQEINYKYQQIQVIENEEEKQEVLNEFLSEYSFVSQKEYVDNLLSENDQEKQEEIDHWNEVFAKAQELQLDEHHYSEDFNKLNSEIAKYNYDIHEQNEELLNIDYDDYLSKIAHKMLDIYLQDESSSQENSNLSKDEAYDILQELGYDFELQYEQYSNTFGINQNNKISYEEFLNSDLVLQNNLEEITVEISSQRFDELLQIAGIENPFENFDISEDSFSFAGKSLNDLQFKLENGSLFIKTFDKDLDEQSAQETSSTFVIDDWGSWDKENTHIELPDGTKINLEALLETIGVEEGAEFIDVNEAFLAILSENETIKEYMQEFENNHIYTGTSQDDVINAYFGDNLIVTGEGNNTITTGAGDDLIFAHEGTNHIDAGLGNDTVSYELSQSAVYKSLEETGNSGVASNDTYNNVENLIGSDFDDILGGSSSDNIIKGNDGNDILSGLGGADVLDGGEGTDISSYSFSQDHVEVNLERNYADSGDASGDSFVSIEGVMGSNLADYLVGDTSSNIFYGNEGNDNISALSGDDIVYGGAGDDFIKGDDGNDTLYGESGDDILLGGSGDDVLEGGTGKNNLLGGEGKDIAVYKGDSTDYEVMFLNENTLLIKSKDGQTQDILKDIEEIAFDDALFTIDYENQQLIKKAEFEEANEIEEQEGELSDNSPQNNQAAAIATAAMIGTVAAAQTEESSSDEITYLSDDPSDTQDLSNIVTNTTEKNISVLTEEHPLYDIINTIKSYNQENKKTTISSEINQEQEIEIVDSNSKNTLEKTTKESIPDNNSQVVFEEQQEIVYQENDLYQETPVLIVKKDETTDLVAANIILNNKVTEEDTNLFLNLDITNPNDDTTLYVTILGFPDTFMLSAGEKKADGSWALRQNDLVDLYMIPGLNDSNDFDITIHAQVMDKDGQTVESIITQRIEVVAVADIPNLEVENTKGLEDTAIPLNISTSLVDDLGGVDGEESITLTIEDVPEEAVLNKGIKDSNGIWHLLPEDLQDLTITPKLNDGDDFTVKVTAYSTESENLDVASVSQDIFVEVVAVADTPNLEVEDTKGLEDTAIPLNISTSLVDDLGGVDGEESIILSIENVPQEAILNAGVRDKDGTWYLLPEELKDLTITPKLNDGDDFTIKVTAYSTESENSDIASVSQDIFVEVVAVVDTPILNVKDARGNEDTAIELDIQSELVDKDGSEILNLQIEGVPQEATLNKGIKDSNGIWHLQKEDLDFLRLTPKENSDEDFTLQVTAITKEKENGDTTTISKSLKVQVDAVADNVVFDLYQTISNQDALVTVDEDPGDAFINIASEFIDLDGSESVHYLVEGLPKGTTLTAGEALENGQWKLLPNELEDLSINLVENSDEDFTLKVTAVTTERENQDQTFTTRNIEVKISSVADFANLNVSNAKGVQNNYISLDIESSLNDNDGSETLEIIIENVPSKATLNKGFKDENGLWHLKQEELKDLGLLPEFDSLKSFDLKVRAISTEAKNGSSEQSVGYIKVDIEPLPSSANITVHPANALEDEPFPLDIKVDTSKLHTNESIYLELTLPNNCKLNQGMQLSNSKWKLELEDLKNLKLETPLNYSGNFLVGINSVIVKANGTLSVSKTTINLPVEVEAVADKPTLEVSDINANEDDLIFFDISSKLQDDDGSEVLSLEISGLPEDAVLNAGEKQDNKWIVEQKDIEILAVLLPKNYVGNSELTIKVNSTESSNHDTAYKIQTINLQVDSVADKPILHISNGYIKDNEAVLNITSFLRDETEELSIKIDNLPEGSFLNKGILNDDGSYTLTASELEDLKILNIEEDIELIIEAKSSVNGQASTITKAIELQILEENKPYINISDIQIQSDTFSDDMISASSVGENIYSGGANDTIYAYDGDDKILADQVGGYISSSFNIETKMDLQEDEMLLIEIKNLPENTISNEGYFEDGSLFIESSLLDTVLTLNYPNQEKPLTLDIQSHLVKQNEREVYLGSSSLSLTLDSQEVGGNDYIHAGKGNDTVQAGEGNDIVLGEAGDDILFGGIGNDFLNGGEGHDKIDAGEGDDFIVMDSEDFNTKEFITQIVDGGDGYDTIKIEGSTGVDFDMSLTNIEKFIGSDGNDRIIGSEFADVVIGGKGADVFYTQGGDDIVYIDKADIKAQAGNFIDTGLGTDTIYIEDLEGVSFDVTHTNAEIIYGSQGNDILYNNSTYQNALYGREGDDHIYASNSIDILDGGKGNDTIDFSNSGLGVNVNLQTNSVSGGYAQGDTISNFENIIGTSYNDILTGNNANNIFDAKDGNNTINGGNGEDTVIIDANLKDFFVNGVRKNFVSSFNSSATIYTSNGITDMTNVEKIQFNDNTIYIDGRRNSPIVYDDKVTILEDTAKKIKASELLKNDFSIEGDNLRIVAVKNSKNGLVKLNADGSVTFTPDENYNSSTNNTFDKNSALYKGKAGFEYIVEDSVGNRTTGYADVNVTAVNDAPTIISHYFNRTSRTTGSGKFVIDDVDSNVDAIRVSVVSDLSFTTSYSHYKGFGFTRKSITETHDTTGSTNINGRTVEADGDFYFSYTGSYWKDKPYVMQDLRPFTVKISDTGDILTGQDIKSIYYQTGTYYHRVHHDPVVLDLDGDGVEIEEKYYEKYDEELIGVSADDAILFWDYDGSKNINSTLETDWTSLVEEAGNDFDALRNYFDTNKDNIFDSKDELWNQFALWQDKNEDGLFSSDEYIHISHSDISQINLEKSSYEEEFPIEEYSSYLTKDGEEMDAAAAYIDTTITDDKLSQEDKLVLQEATKLNEQLAYTDSTENEENIVYIDFSDVYDDEEILEENIA
ncbi:Ig-like domain-containing protein [Halarcobacter anaerophilus]|uniref:Ig-like domain-containing protein n=1 Tax=Halarcobacter anaerophilus TaxID=877500 RepID=UPI0005C8EB02|nr:cadherin-like domain-containing protein [Halarcobacter anaerophilus]